MSRAPSLPAAFALLVAAAGSACGGPSTTSAETDGSRSTPTPTPTPTSASTALAPRPGDDARLSGAMRGRRLVIDGVTVTLPPSAADPLTSPPGALDQPPPEPRPVDVITVAPVGDGEHPSLAPPPPPEPEPVEAPSRARRRMDLEQLDAAIVAATGGIAWTENGVNQWQALAPTLGRPDFFTSTDEDLTPSPLFQKFLGDAARKVCSDLFAREASTPAARRVFFVGLTIDEPSSRLGPRLDANLQRLLLRFHGRDTRQPATAGALDGWRWLWRTTEHLESPRAAWMATCVALIEHPDFSSY